VFREGQRASGSFFSASFLLNILLIGLRFTSLHGLAMGRGHNARPGNGMATEASFIPRVAENTNMTA